MAARRSIPPFWLKLALAAGLAGLANWLIFDQDLGLNLGLVALAFVASAAIAIPAIFRPRLGGAALAISAAFALSIIDRPSPLALLIFWTALVVAVLAPRAGKAEDALRWSMRLVSAGLRGLIGPVLDVRRLVAAEARRPQLRTRTAAASLVLPVAGGLVFFGLFVIANPVLSKALGGLTVPQLDIPRVVFTALVLLSAWAILRPRGLRQLKAKPKRAAPTLPGVTPASVAMSLLVFNAVFALQNGLDLAFLWSGAPLPAGVTLAEYAHRGAYPLIATALLAGLFVLVFLSPGSSAAESRLVRRLVVLWVAQNLLLVASTALRTVWYVQAYSLTSLRIAALVWMALVALGLALICWRLVRGHSAAWLINANALAAGLVLATSALVDYDAVAAAWNVEHARDIDGRGAALDLCHLSEMNGAALVSLARLESRTADGELRERVAYTRMRIAAQMADRQADWLAWRWRDARRLARSRDILATRPATVVRRVERDCQGRPQPPQVAPPARLTPPAQPGT